MTAALRSFADEIGVDDPVAVEGGRTQWAVGGPVADGCRFVRAPEGVVAYHPAEMTVRVGAGTTVEALHAALAEHGQTTLLDGAPHATIGGVLSVGHSGIRRLRTGPLRDIVLEVRYVSAAGRLVTVGGPTVKNVAGFDLCRLLVGSIGTLGLLGQVVLRTMPMPESTQWLTGATPPETARSQFFRPSSVLWDGTNTWVLLEGHQVDVDAESRVGQAIGLEPVGNPPPLPPHRWSIPPSEIRTSHPPIGKFVAEFGVGVLHCDEPAPTSDVAETIVELHRRVKAEFDPNGRLNPGRNPLGSPKVPA